MDPSTPLQRLAFGLELPWDRPHGLPSDNASNPNILGLNRRWTQHKPVAQRMQHNFNNKFTVIP